MRSAFGRDVNAIKVPLDIIDEKEISFTYYDSMATRLMKNDDSFDPKYHEKVFLKSEIKSIIKKLGLFSSENNFAYNEDCKYYIEAQLWNPKYIQY